MNALGIVDIGKAGDTTPPAEQVVACAAAGGEIEQFDLLDRSMRPAPVGPSSFRRPKRSAYKQRKRRSR